MKFLQFKKLFALLLILATGILTVACGSDQDAVHSEEGPAAGSQEVGHVGLSGHNDGQANDILMEDENIEKFGIEVREAGPGELSLHIELPGEITADPDRLVHIVPRISGVAREVKVSLGDFVRRDQLLAVLESRDLSDLKSTFLVAREQVSLTEATFKREERLYSEHISSEREYLEAKNEVSKARIEFEAAGQRLHALGFSEDYLNNLQFHQDSPFGLYQISSPISGTVVEKHISLGEALEPDAEIFTVVDLCTVWINLTVYQKDLPYVRVGQAVDISIKQSGISRLGTIAYISPVVSEKTRAATARVILPNLDGLWRPGLFVYARVTALQLQVPVLIEKEAIATVDDKTVVFVKINESFRLRQVVVSRENDTSAEITSGLEPGEQYVSKGAFTLKSQLEKASFEGAGEAH